MEKNHKKKRKNKETTINIKSASFTILVTILTVVLTKVFDCLWPSRVSFKEIPTEHIVVNHSFDFENQLNDSILAARMSNLLKVEQIEKRINIRESEKSNTVYLENLCPNAKGYSLRSSIPFCRTELKQTSEGFIDSVLDFFDPTIVYNVFFVGLKISKIDSENRHFYVLDNNYIPRAHNILRVASSLQPGKYEFEIGFTFKKDKDKTYPEFYSQRKIFEVF